MATMILPRRPVPPTPEQSRRMEANRLEHNMCVIRQRFPHFSEDQVQAALQTMVKKEMEARLKEAEIWSNGALSEEEKRGSNPPRALRSQTRTGANRPSPFRASCPCRLVDCGPNLASPHLGAHSHFLSIARMNVGCFCRGELAPECLLQRLHSGGGFLGPPLAMMSQSLLEAGSSSDDSSCGSEESKCEGDSERTPPGNRSGNRGRKRKPTNLLCGEDESPATIGKFQRRRSQNNCDSIVRTTHSNAIFSTTDGSTKQGIDYAAEKRETRLGRLDGAQLTCAATRPATTNGRTRRTLPNNASKPIGLQPEVGPPATVAGPQLSATGLEDEFGNEEEEWDLPAIDRSVAMARNGQQRRGLGFSRDRPSVAMMTRNDE
ncbi:hypothetical protein THAOC_27512, partial [Thalassiosira oceanica]